MLLEQILGPLVRSPERTALLFDLDGTLAPIAARPEQAVVPETTRLTIRRLVSRYRLVGCISGRPGAEAAALLGVEEVRCIGNHGLELAAEAESFREPLEQLREEAAAAGLPVEDKGLSLSFHFRLAQDPQAARAALERMAGRAGELGLLPRWGRMVLEVRPPVEADKGAAVRTLVLGSQSRLALYAGDDATDLDAFAALGELELEHAVRVAVDSPEAPAGLAEAADLVVAGPQGLSVLLAQL